VVTDIDADVRRAGVDAIAKLVPADKAAAIKLYKPLIAAEDVVVRSKAEGQLSRLVEPPPKTAEVAPPPAPSPPGPGSAAPPVDDALPKVAAAAADATRAVAETQTAATEVATSAKELASVVAQPAKDDGALKHVEQLAASIETAAKSADAAAARAETAAKDATAAAGATPSAESAKAVAEAHAAATTARTAATDARTKADAADKAAKEFAKVETVDPTMLVAAADAAIATGNLREARHDLDKAQKATGAKAAGIDFSFGQLFDKLAAKETDPAKKKRLLAQAKASYQAFAKAGSGARLARAKERATELDDEIQSLGKEPATP
jgi:hypothetical protein